MGALGKQGVAPEAVLEELDARAADDADWRTGKLLMGLYDAGEAAHDLAVQAYTRYLSQNALYINMYPSIGTLERDIVGSVAELLRADADVCGSITSGGTESIMMAVKTARDWAREHRPEIRSPKMVLPVTAHPAFIKAAHYLCLEPVVTPVDTTGFRADVAAFAEALGPDVILAVGSAPNFSHGTIDPIDEMAPLAAERNILFHVDGCVGGIYLSLMRRMGETVRPFDFSVPGVTSISADLHKYGYAPKNASVVCYASCASTPGSCAARPPSTPSSIPPPRAPAPADRSPRPGQ
jgi:sphinganine-1-phosphate aldolase